MKNLLLLLAILLLSVEVFPQSRKELKREIENYKMALTAERQENAELKQENILLYCQLEKIRFFILQATDRSQLDSLIADRMPSVVNDHSSRITTQPAQSERCAATTNKGTPCSRNTQSGSAYCWQHQNYESKNKSGYRSGHTWHTGPRGGQYYINSKGNKVYKKKR